MKFSQLLLAQGIYGSNAYHKTGAASAATVILCKTGAAEVIALGSVAQASSARYVPIQAVCSRRPDLGHSVLYPGAIDRRRSALDDVATSAVAKHALKLYYADFFCAPGARTKRSRREYVQAGSRRQAA